jgi:hypothetical protein
MSACAALGFSKPEDKKHEQEFKQALADIDRFFRCPEFTADRRESAD